MVDVAAPRRFPEPVSLATQSVQMSVIRSGLGLAKIGLFLVLETPLRPRWAYYRARGYAYHYLLDRLHQKRTAEYARHLRSLHDALAYVLGRDLEEVRAADDSEMIANMVVRERWVVSLDEAGAEASTNGDGPIEVWYGPSPELMRAVNLGTRLLRPETVVETGVAKGFTTASTLEALDRNGTGHMYSVELPSLYLGYARQVGEVIPERLRSRWTLELGPSALAIPRIAERVEAIDLFVHDSGANYDNQKTEYALALAHMPAGGVIVSDMLNSDAFLEMAESIDSRWAVIEQTKQYPIGVLRKLK